MGANVFIGSAAAIAQVSAATITAYDVATTYKVTIGFAPGKVVSVTGTGGTAIATATALVAALNASTYPEFAEVTWDNAAGASATITGTAKTAGVPFTAASSVSGGTGTFGAFATTTASSGPNHWGAPGNWSLGAVPVAADDVYFTGLASTQPVLFDLDQHTVALNSLNVDLSYSGGNSVAGLPTGIGLPPVNTTGSTAYYEYRGTYLQIQATIVNLGTGSGNGCGRLRLNLGSATASTVNVLATGTPATGEVGAVALLGTNAGNTLNVTSGSVVSALVGGEVATWATVRLDTSNAAVALGTGCTLTTVNHNAGTLAVASNVTTYNGYGGSAFFGGTATCTTLNNQGATVAWGSSGTVTTLTVGTGATFDASVDPRPFTLTNATLVSGSALLDPWKRITFSNAFLLQNCALAEVNLDLGQGFSLQRS